MEANTKSSEEAKPVTRKSSTHLRVLVLPHEREKILANANDSGMSVSHFLRNVGMGYPIHSILDHKRVDDLAKVNADLGRLGGLLKMWLTDDKRLMQFHPVDIREVILGVLDKITANQQEMLAVMNKIVHKI